MTERKERRSRHFQRSAQLLSLLLIVFFVALYVQKFYLIDFWNYSLFNNTVDVGDQCTLSAYSSDQMKPKAGEWGLPETKVAIPHKGQRDLVQKLGGKGGKYLHARYRCQLVPAKIPTSDAITYVHLGWVIGGRSSVAVSGEKRVEFESDDKPILSLTAEDLSRDLLTIQIDISGENKSFFGMVGNQPAVATSSYLKNQQIMALDMSLEWTRHLYGLLPVLTLGMVLIFGWWSGIRSRLLVPTLFFFLMAASSDMIYLFRDILPAGTELFIVGAPILTATMMSYMVFGLEVLEVGRKWVGYAMLAISLFLAGMIAAGIFSPSAYSLYVLSKAIHHLVIPFGMLALSIVGANHVVQQKGPRRRVGIAFLVITLVMLAFSVTDAIFYWTDVPIILSRYITVFIPLFVGAVLLYTLSLMQKEFMHAKERRTKIEADLAVAREIQDSLAPPSDVSDELFEVHCLQEKNDKVGGDWLAVRRCDDGRLVAIVADATGKGIQAALVVHAVQSLWADGFSEGRFDPKAWLQRVNRALRLLGERKPHSVTMGILVISEGEVSYLSAGHVPAYVIADGKDVKPLIARGQVLGLNQVLELQESRVELDPMKSYQIVLGSDGVFADGTRTRRRDLLSLIEKVSDQGSTALGEIDVEDDKTLILVRRPADTERLRKVDSF